jgi:hypothetical protein
MNIQNNILPSIPADIISGRGGNGVIAAMELHQLTATNMSLSDFLDS